MDFNKLEATWGKQVMAGAGVPAAETSARLQRELRSAGRRFRGMIVMAAGLLLIEWTLALVTHIAGIKPLTSLELVAHVVGSAFYIFWLVLAVRSARAVQRETESMGGAMRESAAASLRVVELQIRNYRRAVVSLPLAVLAAAMLAFIKFRSGVLPGFGAVVSIGFMSLFLAIVGLAMWRRYRTELEPRRRELRAMLVSVDDAATN